MRKVPMHSIPIARPSRTEYFVRSERTLTPDELAEAVRDGQIDAVAHHYEDGPVIATASARGVVSMDEMRRLAGVTE